jgi:hypothetical protein
VYPPLPCVCDLSSFRKSVLLLVERKFLSKFVYAAVCLASVVQLEAVSSRVIYAPRRSTPRSARGLTSLHSHTQGPCVLGPTSGASSFGSRNVVDLLIVMTLFRCGRWNMQTGVILWLWAACARMFLHDLVGVQDVWLRMVGWLVSHEVKRNCSEAFATWTLSCSRCQPDGVQMQVYIHAARWMGLVVTDLLGFCTWSIVRSSK